MTRHGAARADHRASASKRCPTRRCRKGGPGRDYYGNFVLTGFTVGGGARSGVRQRDGRVRPTHGPTTASAAATCTICSMKPAVDNGDLPAGWASMRRATRRGCGGRRSSRPRRLWRSAAAPLADADVVVPRGPRSARHSAGSGCRSPTAPSRCASSGCRAKTRAALERPRIRSQCGSRKGGRPRRSAPKPPPWLTRARTRSRGTADGRSKDLNIVTALVMQERSSLRAAVDALARARQLHVEGRALYAATPRAAAAAGRARCRTGSASRAGWSSPANPLTARVAVNRAWETVLRPRPRRDAARTSARRERRRAIRSCSTGWRPSSCSGSGA